MAGERSVSEAALQLGETPTATYKRVQRFLNLGLLKVTRSQPRAGKAIRYYRATAESFFIPFRVYPPDLLAASNRALYQETFQRALERMYRDEYFVELNWGVRTVPMPSGDLYLEIVKGSGEVWDYLGDDAPAIATGWNPIWLDLEDAKAMQRELVGVLGKYLNRHGSRAYLAGLFLCDAHEDLGMTRPQDQKVSSETP